jgi:hypothetical protein
MLIEAMDSFSVIHGRLWCAALPTGIMTSATIIPEAIWPGEASTAGRSTGLAY